MGRALQGVRLIRIGENDNISAIARIVEEEKEGNGADQEKMF